MNSYNLYCGFKLKGTRVSEIFYVNIVVVADEKPELSANARLVPVCFYLRLLKARC